MRTLPISIAFAVAVASIAGTSIAHLFEAINTAFEAMLLVFPR